MATLVLLHSALGKTPGIEAIADRYRAAGHTVLAPDVYEGTHVHHRRGGGRPLAGSRVLAARRPGGRGLC